jgi:phage gpG-like protein
MATTANVTVTLDTKKLDAYARNIGRMADQAVEALAWQGKSEVQIEIERLKISPGKTGVGTLLGSIQIWKVADMLWAVGDGVEYGIYHNFGFHPWGGTGYVPARPFMLPGVLRAVKNFKQAVGEWCFPEAQ